VGSSHDKDWSGRISLELMSLYRCAGDTTKYRNAELQVLESAESLTASDDEKIQDSGAWLYRELAQFSAENGDHGIAGERFELAGDFSTWHLEFLYTVKFLNYLESAKEYCCAGYDCEYEMVVDKLIKEVKKRYPNLYRVLIEERNQIMASNLYELMSLNPDKKILAVVGAGHEKDIIKIIKEIKPQKQEISYSFNIK